MLRPVRKLGGEIRRSSGTDVRSNFLCRSETLAVPVVVNSRDILKKNGSAVDASIATLLCVSLLNAHSVGIGGGSNYVIYNASTGPCLNVYCGKGSGSEGGHHFDLIVCSTGKVETINARETAPSNAVEDMFGDNDQLARKGISCSLELLEWHPGSGTPGVAPPKWHPWSGTPRVAPLEWDP